LDLLIDGSVAVDIRLFQRRLALCDSYRTASSKYNGCGFGEPTTGGSDPERQKKGDDILKTKVEKKKKNISTANRRSGGVLDDPRLTSLADAP
jgi:hypothetical protein